MPVVLPRIGQILNNEELHTTFEVGNCGGMRRSKKNNLLVLVTDPFKALYEDKWIDGILHYTGMGQKGDQEDRSQNKTLRLAKDSGIDVYLFESFRPKEYTFLGRVEVCGDIYKAKQADEMGTLRTVLVFPLKVISDGIPIPLNTLETKASILNKAARKRSTQELTQRALAAQGRASKQTTTTPYFCRDQNIVELVKRQAKGCCALCGQEAPFKNTQGEPYLEVHHIIWLSQGGEDSLANTVALCPNCHRKMHVLNLKQDREKLTDTAQQYLRALNGVA